MNDSNSTPPWANIRDHRQPENLDEASRKQAIAVGQSQHRHAGCSSQIVIPARLASTRLPEKLLLRATGKTVLQHTYEAALSARRPGGITVAVDCLKLQREVERFGGIAMLTDPELPSGTDRVVAVARGNATADIFVNVQGDEPEILGQTIDQVIELLESDPAADVATMATPIRNRQQLNDPACVKVVCDQSGKALYFSRSPIPYAREWQDELLSSDPPHFLQHIGIYAYRRSFLLELEQLPPSPLERLEKLEQLRFLQAGRQIRVGVIPHAAAGIDTEADYRSFVERYRRAA